ncbi:MAG: hypothetical protein R2856_21515 [Caldilineaceae bacterium]
MDVLPIQQRVDRVLGPVTLVGLDAYPRASPTRRRRRCARAICCMSLFTGAPDPSPPTGPPTSNLRSVWVAKR